jgi:hypothetical protein
MAASSVRDGCFSWFVQNEQREMLKVRSRKEVMVPIPVGRLLSLSHAGGRLSFTFIMLLAPAWIWG